jgi:hypothetical protein
MPVLYSQDTILLFMVDNIKQAVSLTYSALS